MRRCLLMEGECTGRPGLHGEPGSATVRDRRLRAGIGCALERGPPIAGLQSAFARGSGPGAERSAALMGRARRRGHG
ncbi:hypothetical protein Psi01_83680 [Planobispora siamensis]|uniref:Uncharacterized protein n=1 Tax=Planobispora siamensis TaxID=936338 RepID=A0A8J3SYB3_9ACTN|nr:hypothetical protein Psi01_83680 [Planobispora siamensis]